VAAAVCVPVVKLMEEQGREQLIEPWIEQQLLAATAGPRFTGKGPEVVRGLGAVLNGPADHAGFGPSPRGEIFRMRWENIHWDNGLIFNPGGKSRKSRRCVPLSERVKALGGA
jgi:hypothetical protein